MRVAVLLTLICGGATMVYSCKAPEQVYLRISSNIPCADLSQTAAGSTLSLRDVAVFAGASEAAVRSNMAQQIASAYLDTCKLDANGSLGDIALVRDVSTEPFVAVVAGLRGVKLDGSVADRRAIECDFKNRDTLDPELSDCLITVRTFRYSSSLSGAQIRVLFDEKCVDKSCPGKDQTCSEGGVCISRLVTPIVSTSPPPTSLPSSKPLPPSVDAGTLGKRDAGLPLDVDAGDGGPLQPPTPNVFSCAANSEVQWASKDIPICTDLKSLVCMDVASSKLDCLVATKLPACRAPCCQTPTATETMERCCFVAVAGRQIPLLASESECGKASPPCFTSDECRACGSKEGVGTSGWGVCGPQPVPI